MGKFILLLSLLGTTILFSFGLVAPESPVMWLSSTSLGFALLRFLMMVVLASLLATHPPRNIYMRMFVGSFALALGGWAILGFYNYSVLPMDLLSMLQFSISTGLIVLESEKIRLETLTEEERIAQARQARLSSYSQFNIHQGA